MARISAKFIHKNVLITVYNMISVIYMTVCYSNQSGFRGVASQEGGDAHLATPWAFQKNRRDMIYMRGKKVLNVSKMGNGQKKVGLN